MRGGGAGGREAGAKGSSLERHARESLVCLPSCRGARRLMHPDQAACAVGSGGRVLVLCAPQSSAPAAGRRRGERRFIRPGQGARRTSSPEFPFWQMRAALTRGRTPDHVRVAGSGCVHVVRLSAIRCAERTSALSWRAADEPVAIGSPSRLFGASPIEETDPRDFSDPPQPGGGRGVRSHGERRARARPDERGDSSL